MQNLKLFYQLKELYSNDDDIIKYKHKKYIDIFIWPSSLSKLSKWYFITILNNIRKINKTKAIFDVCVSTFLHLKNGIS